MKYYLALDSGGTKLAAILFDEAMHRCGVCITGSVRPSATPPAMVRAHLNDMIRTLGLAGKSLHAVSGECEPATLQAVQSVCTVDHLRLRPPGELDLGLAAAGLFGDGLLALSGTGATVFARVGEQCYYTGGYGAAVGDEGSGYHIGRLACAAAIHHREGRGDPTCLTDDLPRFLGFEGREVLRPALLSLYDSQTTSPAAGVARLTPVVIAAAAKGDAVAAAILAQAGGLLAEQMVALITAHALPDNMPLTVSGSVWRQNPVFYRAFCAGIQRQSPHRPLITPRMEPVLGAAAACVAETAGRFTPQDEDRLLAAFPEFAYDMQYNPAVAALSGG